MSFNKLNRTPLIKQETRFKSAYSDKSHQTHSIEFPLISPYTKQEFKEECDINTIMAQYERTGLLTHINEEAPQYMDCTGQDFRAHMDYVSGAFSLFEELPAKIRAQFDNDPAEFLDFCSQDKNRPELAAMGLLSDEAAQRYIYPQGEKVTRPETPPSAPSAGAETPPATEPGM